MEDRKTGDERMSNAIVTLKKGEGRALKAGGPWIYDNEIESIMGSFENGDIVLVHEFQNPHPDDDKKNRCGD